MANQGYIEEGVYRSTMQARQNRGNLWRRLYAASFGVAIVALVLLVLTIVNEAFGFVLVSYVVQPSEVSDRPLEQLSEAELVEVLKEQQGGQLVRVVAEQLVQMDLQTFADTPISESMTGRQYPPELADVTPRSLSGDTRIAAMGQLLELNLNAAQLRDIVEAVVLQPDPVEAWPLFDGLLNRANLEQRVIELYPDEATRPVIEFRSWLRFDMLTVPMDDNPLVAGIRTAVLGTLYLLVIVALTAFPIGVMAAIYLEEYANTQSRINRLIENNIRNLAGVPSIIYGMLGLQLFVRALGPITGERTLLSAGLTLALLILPVIIINAQEAIRAVPSSYREGSYGLGATKWQTIWNQVLPAALPGIMTGIILSISRAIGETAPLIVVGAATYITQDPSGLTSAFTALPIQIYNWTSRPQAGFKELAAAAIIILLVMLVLLNLSAFVIRNQARRRLQS